MSSNRLEETRLGVSGVFKDSKSFGSNTKDKQEKGILFKIFLEILKTSFKNLWVVEEVDDNKHNKSN